MKGMADPIRDLGEPLADRTLVLNLLCILNPHYSHLKALIKRIVPFPTFHVVRNDLLLEGLTMVTKAPTAAPALYNAPPGGQAPSGGRPTGAPARPPPTAPVAPRPASTAEGGRRSRKGRREGGGLAAPSEVVPQTRVASRHGRHSTTRRPLPSPCSWARPECLPSSDAGPPESTSLRRASSDASLRCATDNSGTAPARAPMDHHLDALVPTGWRMGPRLPHCRLQHHGDDPTPPPTRWKTLELPTAPLPLQACSLGPIPSIPPTPPRLSLEMVPLCQSPL